MHKWSKGIPGYVTFYDLRDLFDVLPPKFDVENHLSALFRHVAESLFFSTSVPIRSR
jgi:hypothetical protein